MSNLVRAPLRLLGDKGANTEVFDRPDVDRTGPCRLRSGVFRKRTGLRRSTNGIREVTRGLLITVRLQCAYPLEVAQGAG